MGLTCSSMAHGPLMAQIVAESDLQDVKQVLKAQPHAILKSISGRLGTPLHIAAVHGRTAVMQLLLQQAEVYSLQQSPSSGRGVPVRSPVVLKMVNSRNDRNQTPLMMAAAQGHGQCVAVLLDMGANRWAVDSLGGRTALHYAARLNQAQLVTALLEGAGLAPYAMPFPNTPTTQYVDVRTISGFTPLHLAVREGALEAAAALLRAGASLVARNVYDGEWLDCPRGTTPLHLAAQRGNHDMVLLLLTAWAQLPVAARGPDPRRFKDADRRLPVHQAAARGHTQLLPLLDPAQPLAASLGSSGTSGAAVLGPPRLARLAADVLRAKVTAALEAAESAVGAKGGGSSGAFTAAAVAAEAAGGGGEAPDEASSADCPVCLEPLGPGCAGVVLAPCRHTLCLACCQEMHQVLAEATDATRCPLCRAGVCDVTPLP